MAGFSFDRTILEKTSIISEVGGRRKSKAQAEIPGLFVEDDGFEDVDLSSGSPGVGGKAGLPAGFSEEGFPVPAVLLRDLGKEQPFSPGLGDHETVAADLDELGILDFLERGEDGDLNLNILELI